ncbi:MAG: 5-formyltetrahydrofolate cyclo-ligase [Candidatus Binatia bacterium]
MREKKHKLRAGALLQRESLSASELSLWSHLIQGRVLHFSPYLVSRSVALYSSIGNEVATEEIRDHAFKARKKLFYPKLGNGQNLDLIRVGSPEELKPGHYGILEPIGDQVITKRDQRELVVFVPGVAFDIQGNRLGRGKGWYDRVLELLAEGTTIVALAYEFQIVEELPVERWDKRVHHIITERRIVDCMDVPLRSKGGVFK